MSERPAPDRLRLAGMRFDACHGVLSAELIDPQPFEVDVVLHADLRVAAESDRLEATVDYAALYELVRAIVTGPSFSLIEALAGAIVRAVLAATDPQLVGAVEVRVRKPKAPLDGPFETVEVTLVRRNDDGEG